MPTIVPERIQKFSKVFIIAESYEVANDVAVKLKLPLDKWSRLVITYQLKGCDDILIISVGYAIDYASSSLMYAIQTFPRRMEYRNVWAIENIGTLVEVYDIERRIKHLQNT